MVKSGVSSVNRTTNGLLLVTLCPPYQPNTDALMPAGGSNLPNGSPPIIFVYLYFCICIFVFVFLYLYFCICIYVFVFFYLYLCSYPHVGRWQQSTQRQPSYPTIVLQTQELSTDELATSISIILCKQHFIISSITKCISG